MTIKTIATPQINNINNIIFFDIETDDREMLKNDEDGRIIANSEMISFCAISVNDNKTFYEVSDGSSDGEKKLLNKFFNLTKQYKDSSVFSGYNSSYFDLQWLKQRWRKYYNNDFHKDLQHLDYFKLVENNVLKDLDSYKLDFVAKTFLGEEEGKIKGVEGGGGNVYNLWKDNPELLKKYNIQDVVILVKLEEKLKFMKLYMKISKDTDTPIGQTIFGSEVWKNLILKHYPDTIFPEKDFSRPDYPGAFTFCNKPGLNEKILIFDFKSLYPSIMISFNMCFSTFIKREEVRGDIDVYKSFANEYKGKHYVEQYFSKSPGIIPEMLKMFIRDRDEIKKLGGDDIKNLDLYLEQWALKIFANKVYGLFAFPNSAFYNIKIATAITMTAQHLIKQAVKHVQELGYVVVGGDTDSIFMIVKNNKEFDKEFLTKEFEKLFDDILPKDHIVKLRYEKFWKRQYFKAMKNYAVLTEDDEIKITGMSCIKSSFAGIGKKLQKEILTLILRGVKDFDVIKKVLYNYRTRVMTGQIECEDLVFAKRMTKSYAEYCGKNKNGRVKTPPIHARIFNKFEGNYTNPKIRYIVTGVDDRGLDDGLLEDEYIAGYDKFFYWNKACYKLVHDILIDVFPDKKQFLDSLTVKNVKKISKAAQNNHSLSNWT